MRTIERTTQFRRDFRRELRGRHAKSLEENLVAVVTALVNDEPLAERYRDHALSGDWVGFRDCHVRPDLVLIYDRPDGETLRLVRIGSHSELGW